MAASVPVMLKIIVLAPLLAAAAIGYYVGGHNLLSVTMRGHSASATSDPPSPARIRRRLSARDLREIERATARLNVAGVYAIEMLGVKVGDFSQQPASSWKQGFTSTGAT